LAGSNHFLAVFPTQRIKSKRRRLRGGSVAGEDNDADNDDDYNWNMRNSMHDNRKRRPMRRRPEDSNVDNDVEDEEEEEIDSSSWKKMVEIGNASNGRIAFYATHCFLGTDYTYYLYVHACMHTRGEMKYDMNTPGKVTLVSCFDR
jgi:hypothetical protein